MKKYIIISLLVISLVFVSLVSYADSPTSGGLLKVALNGEPGSLDYQMSTANMQGIISKQIFENLFAFNSQNIPKPMLTKEYTISEDNLKYTIKLRENIPFHDGSKMEAEDVVASLNRWLNVSPRGKIVANNIDNIEIINEYTLVINLNSPFSPLLSYLALDNAGAGIMPAEIAESSGNSPLEKYIGTGPFAFNEWKSGHYILLNKFEGYKSRTDDSDFDSGKKIAYLDEIRFDFVPQVSSRIAGVQAGDYHLATEINYDSYNRLVNISGIEPVLAPHMLAPMYFFNHRQGIMSNLKIREAFLAALDMNEIMLGTFGNEKFYELGPNYYPEENVFYSEAGSEVYNQANADKAKKLLEEAGYDGEPITWLTSTEYDIIYNTSIIATQQLNRVGFNINLQVFDWATLIEHRSQPDKWDIFTTYHGYVPTPALLNTINSQYPGWWENAEKDAIFKKYCETVDTKDRAKFWGELQALHWDEVAVVRTGDVSGLYALDSTVNNFLEMLQPRLWNVWLEK